jgi:hypothetical protein
MTARCWGTARSEPEPGPGECSTGEGRGRCPDRVCDRVREVAWTLDGASIPAFTDTQAPYNFGPFPNTSRQANDAVVALRSRNGIHRLRAMARNAPNNDRTIGTLQATFTVSNGTP